MSCSRSWFETWARARLFLCAAAHVVLLSSSIPTCSLVKDRYAYYTRITEPPVHALLVCPACICGIICEIREMLVIPIFWRNSYILAQKIIQESLCVCAIFCALRRNKLSCALWNIELNAIVCFRTISLFRSRTHQLHLSRIIPQFRACTQARSAPVRKRRPVRRLRPGTICPEIQQIQHSRHNNSTILEK